MSAALYCSAAALQRKLSQDLFLDGGDDAWHDAAASADDDYAEPPCFPDDDGGPAPPDHSLRARYAAMRGARSETVLFDVHAGGAASHEHDAELCRELGAAFAGVLGYQDTQDSRASHELLRAIADNTNYEVERVVRVMNRQHYQMQRAFAENYAIHAPRKVFHGTSEAGAGLISAVGFKGAASRRAMFGRGVYTSPDVWNALAYAKPHTTSRQEVVAAVLLQGPTALGRPDQIDFGVDADGSEILTLTNADGSILCAAKENQLLATHRFTLRYMVERGFMRRHRETVRIVHADIAVLIQQAKLLWLASQPPATPPPVQRPQAFRAPAFTARASTAPVWGVVEAARALVAAAPSMPPGAFVAAAAALPGFEDETPREKYADSRTRRPARSTPRTRRPARSAPPAPTQPHTHTHTHTVLGKRQADADP